MVAPALKDFPGIWKVEPGLSHRFAARILLPPAAAVV